MATRSAGARQRAQNHSPRLFDNIDKAGFEAKSVVKVEVILYGGRNSDTTVR
jgi:hypothetical protein